MNWPWRRIAKDKATTKQAEAQAAQARIEYQRSVAKRNEASSVLSALFYHADKNAIVESIQKVARGNS